MLECELWFCRSCVVVEVWLCGLESLGMLWSSVQRSSSPVEGSVVLIVMQGQKESINRDELRIEERLTYDNRKYIKAKLIPLIARRLPLIRVHGRCI